MTHTHIYHIKQFGEVFDKMARKVNYYLRGHRDHDGVSCVGPSGGAIERLPQR